LTLDDRHLRGNAAFVFAGLGDPRGFEVITAILNDRSERTAGQGVAYLHTGPADQGHPDAKQFLALQISADRYYAAHLLGDLKDSRAVPILIQLLNDPEVNYIVPWSLGQIGDRSAVPSLIGALSDRNPDMRVLAIHALEQLGATEALPSLRLLLDDNQGSTFGQKVSVSEAARAAVTKLEPRPPLPPRP
jgi:HEAT repeat protein